jgi:hypothetical protein
MFLCQSCFLHFHFLTCSRRLHAFEGHRSLRLTAVSYSFDTSARLGYLSCTKKCSHIHFFTIALFFLGSPVNTLPNSASHNYISLLSKIMQPCVRTAWPARAQIYCLDRQKGCLNLAPSLVGLVCQGCCIFIADFFSQIYLVMVPQCKAVPGAYADILKDDLYRYVICPS